MQWVYYNKNNIKSDVALSTPMMPHGKTPRSFKNLSFRDTNIIRTLKNRKPPPMKQSRLFSPETLAAISSVPWCCIIFDVLLIGTVGISFVGVFMRTIAHITIPFAYAMLAVSIIRFMRNQHWKSRGQTILLICTTGIVLFSTALHFFVWHFH